MLVANPPMTSGVSRVTPGNAGCEYRTAPELVPGGTIAARQQVAYVAEHELQLAADHLLGQVVDVRAGI